LGRLADADERCRDRRVGQYLGNGEGHRLDVVLARERGQRVDGVELAVLPLALGVHAARGSEDGA